MGYLELSFMGKEMYEIIINTGNNNNGNNNVAKKIHKLLGKYVNPLYFTYQINYGERIQDRIIMDQSYLDMEFDYFKLNNFDNTKSFKYYVGHGLNYYLEYKETGIELIKSYISINKPSNKTYVEICSYILQIDNPREYEIAFKLLSSSAMYCENSLPNRWDEYLKFKIIKSKSTIDWIYENSNWFKYKFCRTQQSYETCELVDYASLKFKSIVDLAISVDGEYQMSIHFKYPFLRALENADITELQNISNRCSTAFSLGSLKFNDRVSKNDKIKLIKYLASTGYKNFSSFTLAEFYKSISDLPAFALQYIGLQYFPRSTIEREMISKLSLNGDSFYSPHILSITRTLFNNPEYSLLERKDIQNFDDYIKNTDIGLFQQYSYTNNKRKPLFEQSAINLNFDQIITCVEIVIGHYQLNKCESNIEIKRISSYLLFLDRIINQLFVSIVRCRYGPIQKYKYIYNLIISNNNNRFNQQEAILIKLNLLSLKSLNIEKYVRLPHFVKDGNTFNQNNYYRYHLLDPKNEFTMDYLFGIDGNNGVTEGELLEKLINNLSHCALINQGILEFGDTESINRNFFYQEFNQNLKYLLGINNHYLFFKELEYIKQFSNTLVQQKYIHGKSVIDADQMFILDNFKFSKKLIENASKLLLTDQSFYFGCFFFPN